MGALRARARRCCVGLSFATRCMAALRNAARRRCSARYSAFAASLICFSSSGLSVWEAGRCSGAAPTRRTSWSFRVIHRARWEVSKTLFTSGWPVAFETVWTSMKVVSEFVRRVGNLNEVARAGNDFETAHEGCIGLRALYV